MAGSRSLHHVSFAAESPGSAHPNLLFQGHFQLFSLSTVTKEEESHQQNRWIQECAGTESLWKPTEPGSHSQAAEWVGWELQLKLGRDFLPSVRFLYYCFPEDQWFRGGFLIKKDAK